MFGSFLSETFAHGDSSTEFDAIFHEYVKKYVEELDYSDSDYPAVSFSEMGCFEKYDDGAISWRGWDPQRDAY